MLRKSSTSDETLRKYQQKPYNVPAHWSTVQPQSQRLVATKQTTPDVQIQQQSSNNDLKVASSQDSRRSENELNFENNENENKNDAVSRPKPLIVEYQPPFLHPIYNRDYTNAPSTSTSTATSTSTTTEVRKTTKKFSTRVTSAATPTASEALVSQARSASSTAPPPVHNRIESRILSKPSTPAAFTVSADRATVPLSSLFSTPAPFAPIVPEPSYPEPPNGLLPPFETFNIPNDATTHGPPLVFEWKIPANDLEPPHFDDKNSNAISIDDNQIPVIPPETAKPFVAIPILEKDLVPPLFDTKTNANHIDVPANTLKPPLFSPLPLANDTEVAASNHSFPTLATLNDALQNFSTDLTLVTDRSQTPRSVPTTSTKRQSETTTNEINYLDLQKQFSIPEFTFPLETVQRPGYQNSNAVNSFQIKIPEKKKQHWYGENANCPECHPSFLKPGTCEPCIKFR